MNRRVALSLDAFTRWAVNPATLVTILGPALADISLWFFVATSTGKMAALTKSPDVCALLEHRTQFYTMIVAYGFFVIELIFGSQGPIARAASRRHRPNWGAAAILSIGFGIGIFVFGGYMMSERVIEMYRAGACLSGVPSPVDPPPLGSPITWIRALIVIVLALAMFTEPRETTSEGKN